MEQSLTKKSRDVGGDFYKRNQGLKLLSLAIPNNQSSIFLSNMHACTYIKNYYRLY
jgi:hypothetical protein